MVEVLLELGLVSYSEAVLVLDDDVFVDMRKYSFVDVQSFCVFGEVERSLKAEWCFLGAIDEAEDSKVVWLRYGCLFFRHFDAKQVAVL